ncbi:MAG: hypothetical protein NC934_07105 [Candidatus Omnitrophica bacterium]|nr:hypothetical protein [Candidatus Omnitrophota bacterium]
MEKELKLGQILLLRKIITAKQLKQALDLQKKESKPIGEILLSMGLLKEEDILEAVMTQSNIPYLDPENFQIDPRAITCIPKEIAEKEIVFPIAVQGKRLTVIMANPFKENVIKEIETKIGYSLNIFLGLPEKIKKFIYKYYGRD